MRSDLDQLVKEELSGEVAKSFVAEITKFHRVQASTMFHEAANYVKTALHDIGLEDARIEQFISDGETKYWTWTTPLGWEVKSAELNLVKPENTRIVRYKDTPTSLHTYSKGTPLEGVTAELMDVGEGTKPKHYEGKDVKGKLVLATGRAKQVHEQAVYKYGALGVITDSLTHEIDNIRESLDIPDAHAYQSIWPLKEELDKVSFGFSLSKRQGNHLRTMLRDGKQVVLSAKVNAKLFPGKLDVVTATIQGASKPDEEIFLIAHLCHPKPSANDNASGCGSLIEIARTIKTLISSGKIKKPVRTIRFLWVPETFGTIAYLYHHEDQVSKLIAGINLDMVGQDQEVCKSTLNLDKTPDSNPSFLNDYIFNLIERSVEEFDQETTFGSGSTFRYAINSFSGGSDHAEFNDSTFTIPCVMLLQWPDLYYHSSMDSIDKVSEDSLKRIGWIATVAVLTLANATIEDTIIMANLTRIGGLTRLRKEAKKTVTYLHKAINGAPEELEKKLLEITINLKNKIEHIVWREKQAIRSVKRIGNNAELTNIIKQYILDIEQNSKHELKRFNEILAYAKKTAGITSLIQPQESEVAKQARKLIPKRLFKGPLNTDALKKAIGEKRFEWFEETAKKDKGFKKKTYEIVNFMNGERSIYDITKAVTAEYRETSLEHVMKFIQLLKEANFIAY